MCAIRSTRTAEGRMAGGTYYVHEHPEESPPGAPLPDLPEAAVPDPVKPEAIPITKKNLNHHHNHQKRVVVSSGDGRCAEDLIFPAELIDAERTQAAGYVASWSRIPSARPR